MPRLDYTAGTIWEELMPISYEVIPWDLEGFGIYNRQFPTVDTLAEAARAIKCPADSIMAWEGGKRRSLTAEEESDLREYQDRLRAEARP